MTITTKITMTTAAAEAKATRTIITTTKCCRLLKFFMFLQQSCWPANVAGNIKAAFKIFSELKKELNYFKRNSFSKVQYFSK